MTSKLKLSTLSFLFFLIFSFCKERPVESVDSQITFSLTDRIKSFELPTEMGHFNMEILQDDHSNLYFFDFKTNSVLVYALENGQLEKQLVFENEGPNGLGGNLLGFYADNPNELYFSTGLNTILKFDGDGILQEKLSLGVESLEDDGVSLLPNIFIKNGSDFYFAALPLEFAWTELSPEQLTKIPNLLHYNLEEKKFIPLSYFPEEFVGNNLNKSIFPLLSKGPEGNPMINMNFRNIYYLKDGKSTAAYAGHSKFPHDPPLSSSPNMFEDMPEIMKMINYTDIYTQFHYFKELDLFVRVAKFEDLPDNGFGIDSHVASKWGLVFLDAALNKVGELDLEDNMFNGTYIFGDKDGVWVSIDHPENPELSEDLMKFRLIEVK